MWRIVIRVVHLDNNTEEATDLRHPGSFPTVTDRLSTRYSNASGSERLRPSECPVLAMSGSSMVRRKVCLKNKTI